MQITPKIYDNILYDSTTNLLKLVLDKMTTKIFTYDSLFEEVYAYLKKTILTSSLRDEFFDIKLDETQVHIKRMYSIIDSCIYYIEQKYNIKFNHAQMATLTLIFRKYVIKNRVAKRNTKKIIIVTNSAIEKSNFFFYLLSQYVDIELVDIININELHLLKDQDFHYVISFSNRIKILLNEIGIPSIKLNFYITNEEIQYLLENGFSTSFRKINIDEFICGIVNKSEEEIKEYIISNYANYFIFED